MRSISCHRLHTGNVCALCGEKHNFGYIVEVSDDPNFPLPDGVHFLCKKDHQKLLEEGKLVAR